MLSLESMEPSCLAAEISWLYGKSRITGAPSKRSTTGKMGVLGAERGWVCASQVAFGVPTKRELKVHNFVQA